MMSHELPTPVLPQISQEVFDVVQEQYSMNPAKMRKDQMEQLEDEDPSLNALVSAAASHITDDYGEFAEEARAQGALVYDLLHRQVSLGRLDGDADSLNIDNMLESLISGSKLDRGTPKRILPRYKLNNAFVPGLTGTVKGDFDPERARETYIEYDPILGRATNELVRPDGYDQLMAGRLGWVTLYAVVNSMVRMQGFAR